MSHTDATSATDLFPRSRRVAKDLSFGSLRHVEVTGSTNADLVGESYRDEAGMAVLVADHQTAGRGRLGRDWEDDRGRALLVSFRIPTPTERAPLIVAAVGAAARAAADSLTSVPVRSKWPNDLVVTEGPAPGKLAGVLAELVDRPTATVVVGVGINIAPIVRQSGATSIVECGGPVDRDALLAALLEELASRLDHPEDVIAELRSTSATLGTRVRVELPRTEQIVGTAVRLTDEGHLVVRSEGGGESVVTVGDVVHLRSL